MNLLNVFLGLPSAVWVILAISAVALAGTLVKTTTLARERSDRMDEHLRNGDIVFLDTDHYEGTKPKWGDDELILQLTAGDIKNSAWSPSECPIHNVLIKKFNAPKDISVSTELVYVMLDDGWTFDFGKPQYKIDAGLGSGRYTNEEIGYDMETYIKDKEVSPHKPAGTVIRTITLNKVK